MSDQEVYEEYVSDQDWYEQYSAYQKRYEENPRDSDLEIIHLIGQCLFAAGRSGLEGDSDILDMGCSTGNLLRLIRKHIPGCNLTGLDYMAPVIDECRNAPDLADMSFDTANLLEWKSDRQYDIVIVNAVTFLFNNESCQTAINNCFQALKPGGSLIGYEYIYPGSHQDYFTEISDGHPNGLVLHRRSEQNTRNFAHNAGFADVQIRPFDISIDLPKPEKTGTDADLMSYTIEDPVTRRRILMRGEQYQPWAHYIMTRGERDSA